MSQSSYRLVIALLVGVVLGMACSNVLSSKATAETGTYRYFHFQAGFCDESDQNSQGIIDLRNGNTWCLSSKGAAPKFGGKLNLAAVPEQGR
jgi:hypothetical protein